MPEHGIVEHFVRDDLTDSYEPHRAHMTAIYGVAKPIVLGPQLIGYLEEGTGRTATLEPLARDSEVSYFVAIISNVSPNELELAEIARREPRYAGRDFLEQTEAQIKNRLAKVLELISAGKMQELAELAIHA